MHEEDKGTENGERIMYILIEILVNLLLLGGLCLIRWAYAHKSITMAIFAAIVVIIDIYALIRLYKYGSIW